MNAGEGEFVATTDRCGVPAKMEYKIYIYIYIFHQGCRSVVVAKGERDT